MVIRDLALKLTSAGFGSPRGLAQHDFSGEATRLFNFVRDEIRYVKDIDGVETLHPPQWILPEQYFPGGLGAGDCDDKAILLAALLLSIGHTPRFVAVAFAPDEYSHVWLQDYLNGRWVDMEATELFPFGKAIPLQGADSLLTLEA